MRLLDRRLRALEGMRGRQNYDAVLDAMSDDDLARLEALIEDLQLGRWSTPDDLADDDGRFLLSVLQACKPSGETR